MVLKIDRRRRESCNVAELHGQAHGSGVGVIWVYVDVVPEGARDVFSWKNFCASRLLRFSYGEIKLHRFSGILKKTDRKIFKNKKVKNIFLKIILKKIEKSKKSKNRKSKKVTWFQLKIFEFLDFRIFDFRKFPIEIKLLFSIFDFSIFSIFRFFSI